MMEGAITWGKQHPYMLGGIVFVVGLLLLWWFGFFAKKQTAGGGGVQDYYAAETAGAMAASADLQSNNATEAAIAGVNAARDVGLAQANTDLAKTQIGGDVAKSIAATNAEVTDKQTASALQTGLAFIDFQRQASTDAVRINDANTRAAVTTSAEAAHVAEGQTIAGIITSQTGLLQTEQAPASLGVLAARLWGSFTGASNSDPNVGYPTGSVVPGVGFVPVAPNVPLTTVPMSNGPTSNFIADKYVAPQAPNTAAENQGLNAGSTFAAAIADKMAFLTRIGQPPPTVGYAGKA